MSKTSTPMISLYPYQQRWLEDDARFKIALFARQTGKTFMCTLEIVLDCLTAMLEGRKTRWIILSRGERQAKEAMEEGVKKHCEAINILLSSLNQKQYGTIRCSVLEAVFPGGSKITALPANADTARGFSGNVFLDEFAFHADSHKIWAALFPVISAGYKIRIASTPNGKHNKFYDLMTNPALGNIWSRHQTDIYQAVKDGLNRNIDQLKGGLSDPVAWQSEYELSWEQVNTQWLSETLIHQAMHPQAGQSEHYEGNPCFVGVDIGRWQDLFVIWVIEHIDNVLWTREIIAQKNLPFAEQARLLNDVFSSYRVLRCCMDQTGMGAKPVEDAQYAHGKKRVEGVTFTQPAKLLMATMAKEAFEAGIIKIPHDKDAINDLGAIKQTFSPTGSVKLDAARTNTGHADRAWACFLACYAAATKPIGHITSASPRKAKDLLTGYDE